MTGVSAGYSATPQSRKLGLREGCRIALIDPPDQWTLMDPPSGLQHAARGPADVIVRFVRSPDEIRDGITELERRIFPDGMIWFAWPRRTAGHQSDVTEDGIRDAVLADGLVDVKVCAIDEDWSGLKVVWRRSNRGQNAK